MISFKLSFALALFAVIFCHSASMCQSSAFDSWQKIDADGKFAFLLPGDMKQSSKVGIEYFVREYTSARMMFRFAHKPWGFPAYGKRRAGYMKDYRERVTQIDGKLAYVRTFYTKEKDGRRYVADLVVGDWAKRRVALHMSLVSSDAADLDIAGRIFDSIDFP